MPTVEEIISSLRSAIENTRNRIAQLESELETLKAFKRDVETSHDSFILIRNKKNQYISDLMTDVTNNKCVTTLSEGMNHTLNMVGVVYVKAAFLALIASINLKIAWYEIEIFNEKTSLTGLLGQLEGLI